MSSTSQPASAANTYLYKFEAELELHTEGASSIGSRVAIIIMADNDRSAFSHAEVHLEKHFIKPPVVKELALIEKRRIHAGAGYVIEMQPGV